MFISCLNVLFCRKAPLCNASALFLSAKLTFSCHSTFWCFASLPGLSTFLAEGRHTRRLALPLSCLSSCPKHFLCVAVKQVIIGVISCVVQILSVFQVLVDIVVLYLQEEAVCVCLDDFTPRLVLLFERVVEKKSYIRILLLSRIVIPAYTGLSSLTFSLCMLKPAKLLKKCVHPAISGIVISLGFFLPLRTILMSTRFLTFSIVFPNTELSMSL